jgi:hypothetical protein
MRTLSVTAMRTAPIARDPDGTLMDPEGLLRVWVGEGQELRIDILDLEAVERVHRFGIAGISRIREQLGLLADAGTELPMYGDRIRRRPSIRS